MGITGKALMSRCLFGAVINVLSDRPLELTLTCLRTSLHSICKVLHISLPRYLQRLQCPTAFSVSDCLPVSLIIWLPPCLLPFTNPCLPVPGCQYLSVCLHSWLHICLPVWLSVHACMPVYLLMSLCLPTSLSVPAFLPVKSSGVCFF